MAKRTLEMSAEEYKSDGYKAMSERTWGLQVETAAKLRGWMYYHTWNSRNSAGGFPDYVFSRGGDILYAELKTETGKLTPKQIQWRYALLDAGNEWHLWRPSDEDAVYARLDVARVPSKRGPDENEVQTA